MINNSVQIVYASSFYLRQYHNEGSNRPLFDNLKSSSPLNKTGHKFHSKDKTDGLRKHTSKGALEEYISLDVTTHPV